jgi:hypothetical protein
VTRPDFEALMTEDGWDDDQRRRWSDITPVLDRATFYREMSKPDGVIEVTFKEVGCLRWIGWRRLDCRDDRALTFERSTPKMVH